MMIPELSLLETRVLGVLIEKERTVPDSYPLTLNALVTGSNQKTSRDPIINATESEIQVAIDSLRSMSLVIESSGGRVARYSHNFERVLQVPKQASAILAALMLRGPQTAGELRINCERLHSFADISSVEAFLQELAERPFGALVSELPRQPGSRENRWMHLLSGAREVQQSSASSSAPTSVDLGASELATVKAKVARLEAEVSELKALISKICSELGIRQES
ncbi:MAG TPA: YceH family protein [Burkholderiales bacterium]|nr:YceH family protein [Burkholderiales bacterium]